MQQGVLFRKGDTAEEAQWRTQCRIFIRSQRRIRFTPQWYAIEMSMAFRVLRLSKEQVACYKGIWEEELTKK